jgi:hypothetical protein
MNSKQQPNSWNGGPSSVDRCPHPHALTLPIWSAQTAGVNKRRRGVYSEDR